MNAVGQRGLFGWVVSSGSWLSLVIGRILLHERVSCLLDAELLSLIFEWRD